MTYAPHLVYAGIVLVVLSTAEWSTEANFSEISHPRQVFPPRNPHSGSSQDPTRDRQEQLPPVPRRGPQGTLITQIPFEEILGDSTKSYIELSNLRSPHESNFVVGHGLAGRISQEAYVVNAGSGNLMYVHIHGLSNPPSASTEGRELRLRFVIPSLQFKTFYIDYTPGGDADVRDMVADNAIVDVYFTPTITKQRLPTIQSVRVVFKGTVNESGKCTHFFNLIPLNVCGVAKDYLNQIKPNLENGMREALMHPRARARFDQLVWQYLRAELLSQAGINPASRSQVSILQASFRGTDYVVDFLPQP
jgi:hypothetical protein